DGVVQARRVIRRHRLIELFLTQVLGLDWSEVDAEAEALEHAISPRLEQAIAAHLGEPLEDPHGHPIPSASGELAHRDLHRLSEFRADQAVVIREAQDDNRARLRRWRDLGLTPGTVVRIVSYQPLDDLFEVEVGGRVIRLGSEGLAGLRGEPADGGGRGSRQDTGVPCGQIRGFDWPAVCPVWRSVLDSDRRPAVARSRPATGPSAVITSRRPDSGRLSRCFRWWRATWPCSRSR